MHVLNCCLRKRSATMTGARGPYECLTLTTFNLHLIVTPSPLCGSVSMNAWTLHLSLLRHPLPNDYLVIANRMDQPDLPWNAGVGCPPGSCRGQECTYIKWNCTSCETFDSWPRHFLAEDPTEPGVPPNWKEGTERLPRRGQIIWVHESPL